MKVFKCAGRVKSEVKLNLETSSRNLTIKLQLQSKDHFKRSNSSDSVDFFKPVLTESSAEWLVVAE